MGLSCVYTVVNGMMLKETRNGVETEYVPDTNGNLWMTRDMSGNVTSTTEYWPYGEVQTSTGTNPSPLGFGGIVGYITDTLTQLYVRARSYRADRARWITVDPLWPLEFAYSYVKNAPLFRTDPTGLLDWCLIKFVACNAVCVTLVAALFLIFGVWLTACLGGCTAAGGIWCYALCWAAAAAWLAVIIGIAAVCAVACEVERQCCYRPSDPQCSKKGPGKGGGGGGGGCDGSGSGDGGGPHDPCSGKVPVGCFRQADCRIVCE